MQNGFRNICVAFVAALTAAIMAPASAQAEQGKLVIKNATDNQPIQVRFNVDGTKTGWITVGLGEEQGSGDKASRVTACIASQDNVIIGYVHAGTDPHGPADLIVSFDVKEIQDKSGDNFQLKRSESQNNEHRKQINVKMNKNYGDKDKIDCEYQ